MTQHEDISSYLSNLNSLSIKFPEFENYVPNDTDDSDSITELLDLLKIHCGEKIVVDFDNEDGWTWRDEHSGPFSWMTRSQQDLTEIGTEQDMKSSADLQTPRKATISVDDPTTTGAGLSEIQAAFQKFGLSSVDESELRQQTPQQTITVEIERSPVDRDSGQEEVPSPLSSGSASPVHQATPASPSFSPVHQPTPVSMRRWSEEDRSDTEAEESLISQANSTGFMSSSFVLEPPAEFQSESRVSEMSADIAGVHSTHHQDSSTDQPTSSTVFTPQDTNQQGYNNTGIDLGADLTTDSTTDVQKTGFDFLDNW